MQHSKYFSPIATHLVILFFGNLIYKRRPSTLRPSDILQGLDGSNQDDTTSLNALSGETRLEGFLNTHYTRQFHRGSLTAQQAEQAVNALVA